MAIVLKSVVQHKEEGISEAIEKLIAIKTEIASLKKVEKTLTMAIQREMGSEEVIEDITGESLCTWKFQDRRTFNSKRFENDHPDMAKEYIETKQVRVFRV